MLIKYWTNLTACSCIFIARQRSCRKVMFSVVCVCLFGGGVSCDHYLTGLPISWTPTRYGTFLYRDPWPPVSDIWWPSLRTCSRLFTPPTPATVADIWWQLLKNIPSADGTHPTGMLSCFYIAYGTSVIELCTLICPGLCHPCLFSGHLSPIGPWNSLCTLVIWLIRHFVFS